MKHLWCSVLMLLMVACSAEPIIEETATATPRPTATSLVGVSLVTRAAPTVALVQVTPSPLPSATPTPTPTLVVYTVQSGDTLWSIAYSNGTIPDAVIALNPNMNADFLSIGDELVMPPPATPLASGELVTSVPLAIEILSVVQYRTPVGSAWLVGEVLNASPFAAESVQIELELETADGAPIGTVNTWLATGLIPAGARAPFALLLPDASADVQVASAHVSAGNAALQLGNRTVDFAASDVAIAHDGSATFVTGTIVNSSTLTSTASLVATLYDTVGQVSGFARVLSDRPIAPGEMWEFSAETTVPGALPTDVEVLITGLGQ